MNPQTRLFLKALQAGPFGLALAITPNGDVVARTRELPPDFGARLVEFLYPEFGPVTLMPFDDCRLYQRRQSADRPMVDFRDATRLLELGSMAFEPDAAKHGAGGGQ